MAAQEQKLIATAQKLQTQVDSFRTKKETMKATYTAAEAQTKIGEAVSGISESMSDAGMSMQRAQDKIDGMQARAGAMDELLASGALTDLSNPVDDIQAQLNKASTTSTVDAELAALKAEVGTGAPAAGPAELGGRLSRSGPRGHPVVIVRILGEGQYSIPDGERARSRHWTRRLPRPSTAGTRRRSPRPGRADRRGPASWVAAGRRRLRPLRPGRALPRRHPRGDQGPARRFGRRPRATTLRHPMSTARNIPPDRGLTLRMFTTGLMLVILYAAVIGLLIAFGISYVVVLVFAAIILFVQYWFSDKIALFGMGGPDRHARTGAAAPRRHRPAVRPGRHEEAPGGHRRHRRPQRLRHRAEPEQRGGLRHHRPHAPAGRVRARGRPVPRALPRGPPRRGRDDHRQLLGHGGRHGHPDHAVVRPDGRIRRREPREQHRAGNDNAALVEMLVLAVSVAVYAISFLLTMALSRYRELAADRSGALLTGQPSALASALVKVTGEMSRIPTRDLRSTESFNAFYFTPAIANSGGQPLHHLLDPSLARKAPRPAGHASRPSWAVPRDRRAPASMSGRSR